MIDWEWTKNEVDPDDILDGARAIKQRLGRHGICLTCLWTPAETLLEWAKAALERGGDDGWDSAAGLAKRAVCRQMDCILVHNYLGGVLGKNYGVKSGYLARLRVPALATLRDLVIDPRNDIEHAYAFATEDQATRACEIAELFLGATKRVAAEPAIIDLGWDFEHSYSVGMESDRPKHTVEVRLKRDHDPFLVVSPDIKQVTILYPSEELLSVCSLDRFTVPQAFDFNDILRVPHPLHPTKSFGGSTTSIAFLHGIRRELKL